MEAIILAGGIGSRLKSVVKAVPKPMAEIDGRPFLDYLLELLLCQGVERTILAVGYKYEVIEGHYGKQYKTMDIDYSIEHSPLGTGGGMRASLEMAHGENVVVMNGDSFINVALKNLFAAHTSKNADLTLTLKPMSNFDRYGTVVTDGEKVVGFEEKTFQDEGLINAGVYMVSREKVLGEMQAYESAFSFETDFLPENIKTLGICYYILDEYFIDIGMPEDLLKAQQALPVLMKRFQI